MADRTEWMVGWAELADDCANFIEHIKTVHSDIDIQATGSKLVAECREFLEAHAREDLPAYVVDEEAADIVISFLVLDWMRGGTLLQAGVAKMEKNWKRDWRWDPEQGSFQHVPGT